MPVKSVRAYDIDWIFLVRLKRISKQSNGLPRHLGPLG